jgi:uncharacterized repeat protein (TIGR01451 family)
MSGPEQLIPGDNIPLKLTVKNDLPTEISNVVVTDLMPQGLTAVEVTAASTGPENLQIIDAGVDGQLVVAFLDKMGPGDEANIFVTVTVSNRVRPGTQMRNTATLFYRESAADQDSLDLIVGSEGPSRPGLAAEQSTPAGESGVAPTAVAEAETEALPAALPEKVTPEAEQEEGAAFVPPGKMPGTGADLLSAQTTAKEDEAGLTPPGKIESSAGEFLSPQTISDSGSEFSPSSNILPLPITREKPIIGLIPAVLLVGLGAGGLLSVLRHLRSARQEDS